VKAIAQKGSLYQRTAKRVLSYYVVNNEPFGTRIQHSREKLFWIWI